MFEYVTFGVGLAFIPIYASIRKQKGETHAYKFTNTLLVFVLAAATLIIIILQIFTPFFVRLFARGFTGATLELTVFFTRIISWNIYFLIMANIFGGYLQIKDKYILCVLGSLPYDLLVIVSIILAKVFNNSILAYGIVMASAGKLVWILLATKKEKYQFKAGFDLFGIKQFGILVLPVVAVVITEQVNTIIDRTLASAIVVGGISALGYADKVNAMIRQLLIRPLAVMEFPHLCDLASKNEFKSLGRLLSNSVKTTSVIIFPATVGVMVLSEPFVRLLFGRGAFDEKAVLMTSGALMCYAVGLSGYSFKEILSRTLYSMRDSKTALLNSVICVLINIILNLILSKFIGLNGLALATAIAGNVAAIHLFFVVRRRIGKDYIGLNEILSALVKTAIASITMGLIVWAIYLLIPSIIGLFISVLIGICSYILFAYLLKIDEVSRLISKVKEKLFK